MKALRPWWGLLTLALTGACAEEHRALVFIDASSGAVQSEVAKSLAAFERTNRPVRVVHVNTADEAMLLAARGEGDVVIVPDGTDLASFVSAHHGRSAGDISLGGSVFRVIEVDATTHPKVDRAGAEALTRHLLLR